MLEISILGAGSWGCTLANLLAYKDYKVKLWEVSENRSLKLKETKILESLPNFKIHSSIEIDSDLEKVLCSSKIILFVLPSNVLRETLEKIKMLKLNFKNTIIISAIKGIETSSLKRMTEIIKEELPLIKQENIFVLSGPSFAIEVYKKLPTAIVIAGQENKTLKKLQNIFFTEYFRVYTNNDIKGVELGGALKNIFAIACGISDGCGFGDNTKAALMTRGFKELIKIGVKLGGQKQTFLGLSGLGDLVMTSFSKHSRNRLLGEKIGQGLSPENALKEISTTTEGYYTTKAVYMLGKKLGLDLPIVNEVFNVLYKCKPVKQVTKNLMLRKLKSEMEGYE